MIPSELTATVRRIKVRWARAPQRIWCDFTKATDGVETWSPKFFYVGCRYFEVKRFRPPAKPDCPP
jgi:hypothetical protein